MLLGENGGFESNGPEAPGLLNSHDALFTFPRRQTYEWASTEILQGPQILPHAPYRYSSTTSS